MPAIKNSKPSRASDAGRKPSPAAGGGRIAEVLLVFLALCALSAAAVWYCHRSGYTLYYGDAEAHLNIARRVADSRTPGYRQIGTVWLPLPHALMLPLVSDDRLWRSGLAGAIPAAGCFVLAGTFLFAAVRRVFLSRAAAFAAACLFAFNPNLLYLQSTPMTEPVFFAALAALLYFSVRFGQTQSLGAVLGAALAALAGTLARYDGWFLIPFVTLYFAAAGGKRRWRAAILFGAIASLGPLYWLAHNWWFFGDALEFYRGPYSAHAYYQRNLAAGMKPYPGDHDWAMAFVQFRAAARLCAGLPLLVIGLAGIAAAALRRAVWPVVLLALPAAFYLWSLYSGGTPIYVPELYPHSYYNTRYGLAALPLAAFGGAALAALVPDRFRKLAAAAVIVAGISPWLAYPRAEAWICWKESQVNSEARRAWTEEAAEFLRAEYRRGDGIFTSFSDLMGIYRVAGIPFRETLHEEDEVRWYATAARPDLFLREKWVVGISGDRVTTAVLRAQKTGPRYDRVKLITVKGGDVIEIYRRAGGIGLRPVNLP